MRLQSPRSSLQYCHVYQHPFGMFASHEVNMKSLQRLVCNIDTTLIHPCSRQAVNRSGFAAACNIPFIQGCQRLKHMHSSLVMCESLDRRQGLCRNIRHTCRNAGCLVTGPQMPFHTLYLITETAEALQISYFSGQYIVMVT